MGVCVGDGGVLCWHEWVNHSHCCPGSRAQHSKQDSGKQEGDC